MAKPQSMYVRKIMLEWFKKKDPFVLVKTMTVSIVSTYDHNRKGQLFFYLYESKFGRRKEERKASNGFDTGATNISDYYEIVYPWLQGQDFPDIPSYWSVVKEKRKDDIKIMYRRFFSDK